jgi:hypothetical protein
MSDVLSRTAAARAACIGLSLLLAPVLHACGERRLVRSGSPPVVRFTRVYNVAPVQNPPLRPNAPAEAQVAVTDDKPMPSNPCVAGTAAGACTGARLDCTELAGVNLVFRTTDGPGTCRLSVTVRDSDGLTGSAATDVAVADR